MLSNLDIDTSTNSEVALSEFGQNDKDSAKDFLEHHGIKGQKWGHRRFQNSDGSLTTEGRKRYGVGPALETIGRASKAAGKMAGKAIRKATGRQTDEELDAELAKARYKHDRQMKKEEINALSGKRKNISKMTDEEVDDYINRLSKERSAKLAEKDLKRLNRGDFSNFLHDLKTKSYEGIAEGAKEGLRGYASARIKQVGAHRMDMKDRKWNEKHETDHLTEVEKLARANAISKAKYDIAKNDRDRRKILSGQSDEDVKDAATNSKNRLDTVRNDIERRALQGDAEALQQLRTFNAAKGSGKGGGKKGGQQPLNSIENNGLAVSNKSNNVTSGSGNSVQSEARNSNTNRLLKSLKNPDSTTPNNNNSKTDSTSKQAIGKKAIDNFVTSSRTNNANRYVEDDSKAIQRRQVSRNNRSTNTNSTNANSTSGTKKTSKKTSKKKKRS